MGAWNVTGLNGKEDEIIEEIKSYNIDYLAVTETKKTGKGLEEIKDGYWLYWAGVEGGHWGAEGVGLLEKEEKMENIIEEKYVNERLLVMKTKLDNRNTTTLIIVYGPNDNARKNKKRRILRNTSGQN